MNKCSAFASDQFEGRSSDTLRELVHLHFYKKQGTHVSPGSTIQSHKNFFL